MLTYVAGLVFSLRTHRDLFNPEYEDEETWGWSVRTSRDHARRSRASPWA